MIGLDSSSIGYEPNWILSALFLENYQNIFFNDVGNVSPMPVLWSLCIEEHFYILWGLALYFLPAKRIPLLIIILIISATIARIIFLHNQWPFKDITTNIDYFMYGAIPAYLFVFAKEQTIQLVSNIPTYLKVILPILILIYLFSANSLYFPYYELVEPVVFGLLFGALILLLLPEKGVFKISDHTIFSKWGTYTYGLYLIHVIAINLVIQIFRKLHIDFELHYLMFIALAFVTTLLGSYVSYRYIEKPFLRLKKGF
jgi:peptidoglycan/LPS O-acetylase OafA/YrhL